MEIRLYREIEREHAYKHMFACVNTNRDKHHIIVHIACWLIDSMTSSQAKLFKPGALTPSSMASSMEVPGWESVVEVTGMERFAIATPCSGTSIPATPMWTDAQMVEV